MNRYSFCFFLLLNGMTSLVDAADVGMINKIHKDPDGKEAKYVLFVPHDYKGDKEYPLILFLHGAGETGTDGMKQTQQGLGTAIKKNEAKFGFITIFPQSQKRSWNADGEDGLRAIRILEEVQKEYKVDSKRIYLTGLSMGGYGTWSFAVKYPDRWAAMAPICGVGDVKTVEKIKHIPCWCFHGDEDRAVKVERSREMMEALKKAGGKPRYTEYNFVGHNSWDPAYATGELYSWFLQQKK